MRCHFCRRRLHKRVYYYDQFSCCFDCFEDKLTEDTVDFYCKDPVSVTEIY